MSAARLAAALLLVLLAGSGCRRADEGAPLVVAIGEGPVALGDPLRPPSSEAQALLRQASAQGLVRFDPAGQIEPGIAERWNVSDDGLSYIFRLATGQWADGRKIVARDVARLIQRQVRASGDSATRDAVGAIDEVVAMTDRVVEIRLRAPRPNLLALLAQPEFALIREGVGSGPFAPREAEAIIDGGKAERPLRLRREIAGIDGEPAEREDIALAAMPAKAAVAAFQADRAALVIGGTFADLPLAQASRPARGTLQFDPVAGLFGLVPARRESLLAKPEVRRILGQAIDRQALLAALSVPGLAPRATVLEAGLYGLADPLQPPWLGRPLAERRAGLTAALRRALEAKDGSPPPTLTLALPEGPGAELVFNRIKADWGAIGLNVERAPTAGRRADLIFLDEVAPSDSPAWFLRHFRCAAAAVCSQEVDALLDAAREAPAPAQRAALLAQAAAKVDGEALFFAIAAPVRWSLVQRRIAGFVPNRTARHPLTGLASRPASPGAN